MHMPKGRILVVDDEQILEQLYEIILASVGYEHVSFHDLREATRFLMANHSQIDLALIDITMRGIKGDDIARQIAQIDPGLPIIMMSDRQTEQIDGNVRAILHKPVLEEELLQSVEKYMRHTANT